MTLIRNLAASLLEALTNVVTEVGFTFSATAARSLGVKLVTFGMFGLLVATVAQREALGQPNLLRNPSFENTPSMCSNSQGNLPAEWLQSGSIVPGADTWNDGETDSCYGLLTGTLSRWIGVMAPDGDQDSGNSPPGAGAPTQ